MTSDIEFYSDLAVKSLKRAIRCYQSGLEWLDRPEYRREWRMDSIASWHSMSDDNVEQAVRYARTAARFALPILLESESCQ